MPSLKSIRFPGSSEVYEIEDATARANIANVQASVNTMVDSTLSTAGKAADAKATQQAIDTALDEAKGVVDAMGLVVVDGVLCMAFEGG